MLKWAVFLDANSADREEAANEPSADDEVDTAEISAADFCRELLAAALAASRSRRACSEADGGPALRTESKMVQQSGVKHV